MWLIHYGCTGYLIKILRRFDRGGDECLDHTEPTSGT